jgi:hypothetical protein
LPRLRYVRQAQGTGLCSFSLMRRRSPGLGTFAGHRLFYKHAESVARTSAAEMLSVWGLADVDRRNRRLGIIPQAHL